MRRNLVEIESESGVECLAGRPAPKPLSDAAACIFAAGENVWTVWGGSEAEIWQEGR
jgi:hypothetical protein